MSLSEKIKQIDHWTKGYSEKDVKEFIKDVKFHGEIHLGNDTLTIKYSKFKELAGKELI